MEYRRYYCTPSSKYNGKGYYGTVSGIKNAQMISADSLELFEEEFHRYVDEYLREVEQRKSKKSKRAVIISIIMAAVFVIMAVTCPSEESHAKSISNAAASIVDDGKDDFLDILSSLFVTYSVENHIKVDNYVIFSIGKWISDGEENVISVGVFNHVFLIPKERMKEILPY